MGLCAMQSGALDVGPPMPTSAAVSSSSESRARVRAGPAGSVRSCCFAGVSVLFFVYGFAKSAWDSLRRDELKAFRLLADAML